VEASAIHASAGLGRTRVLALTTPLLRLRSDQQLVGLFRGGNDDAFRVIHDRYRARLLAYVRQMLARSNPDAEDVLQDVFVRAFAGLRANGRELSLRPWLYRIAHNRCVDELRRPVPPAPEAADLAPTAISDPVLESETRESLRRLIIDIRRLPDQQRSALLMREMSGMAYTEVAGVLGLSVPAVKSLLVRARLGLAAALEARDAACHEIRAELAAAHDRGVRPSGLARRHLHDCPGCREYRSELRSVSRQLAALTPSLGPLVALARLIGLGSGGGVAAGGTGSGVLAAGGAASAGTTVFGVAATHVAAVVAAAVVTAGGAVEIQRTVATQVDPAPAHHAKRSVSVGQGTSAEGSVAAIGAAHLASDPPAPVQQGSAPAEHSRQDAQAVRPKRSEKAGKALAAKTTAPSPPAAAPGTGTGTPAAGDSTTAAANPPSCQIASASGQAPATSSATASSSGSGSLPCSSSTATGTDGTVSSTSPSSSSGSSSSNATNGTTGAAGTSTPTSGSPVSPQAPDSQAQKS
jgi:RNA polymerase sigma factor (sigma-70 family)